MQNSIIGAIAVVLLAVPAKGQERSFDESRARSLGIRKLVGQHITLFTDLPSQAEVDALPQVFDQAFPQWCEFFLQSPKKLANWHMTGFLMRDQARFRQCRMIPADLPVIPHGYSRGNELWLIEQPSDYYRRHLLLHEGAHGFMNTALGGGGPQWYMEGIAELLATHRWHDGRLTLNYLPANRDEMFGWGRISLIQDAVAKGQAKTFPDVINTGSMAHREVEAYAWCWAATMLLDRHPRYHERFRQLSQFVTQADFNRRFRRLYASDWQALCEEWQVMVADLQYGHDLQRSAIDFVPGKRLPADGASVEVAADRGWQSSRIELRAGQAYRLKASGRFQLNIESQPIKSGPQWCEANGVSIHYHQGKPLGVLLAAMQPGKSALIHPIIVGLEGVIRPTQTGTLYLKLNQSPAALANSTGKITVEVSNEP